MKCKRCKEETDALIEGICLDCRRVLRAHALYGGEPNLLKRILCFPLIVILVPFAWIIGFFTEENPHLPGPPRTRWIKKCEKRIVEWD